jgi:vacuole membrane protein 1
LQEDRSIPTQVDMASTAHEHLTPQDIADMEEDWKEDRMKITLWQSPGRTLYLFSKAGCKLIISTIKYLILHPVMVRFLTPLFVLWIILEFIPGPYTEFIDNIEFWIAYVVWWVGLGILSSIGLGSGLQTGVLFLFPHIMKVCLTAQTCKSVNFNSFGAIWFRRPHDLFKCTPETDDSLAYPASYLCKI